MEIKETTRQELFEILYIIEDIENKTELGERVSKLLTELEKQLDMKPKTLKELEEENKNLQELLLIYQKKCYPIK